MYVDDVRFATTGFVTAQEKGPLSISLATPTELVLIDVLFGPSAAARLRSGQTLHAILEGLTSLEKSETWVPLSGLQSLCWIDNENGLTITWLDEEQRLRRKTTYIANAAARTQLLECLAEQLGMRPREVVQPAGIWRLAWSQFLGAALSLFLTGAFLYFWDPQAIARVDGGNIALWLGQRGCALVGLAFFVACVTSAWRRVSPRPMHHCWEVRSVKARA